MLNKALKTEELVFQHVSGNFKDYYHAITDAAIALQTVILHKTISRVKKESVFTIYFCSYHEKLALSGCV